MKITPIIFSGPMVRALLSGAKSQTRRIVKPQPYMQELNGSFGGRLLCFQERGSPGTGLIWPNAKENILSQCPYGRPDRPPPNVRVGLPLLPATAGRIYSLRHACSPCPRYVRK